MKRWLLLLPLVFGACSAPAPVAPKLAPSVVTAAYEAVSTGTSPEDQAKKAAVFQQIALELNKLPADATPEAVRAAVVNTAPSSPHWLVLATVLAGYYQQYSNEAAAASRRATASAIAGEIAKGLVQVAATSLTSR